MELNKKRQEVNWLEECFKFIAYDEILFGKTVASVIMDKAIAESKGDETLIAPLYIKFRIDNLKRQYQEEPEECFFIDQPSSPRYFEGQYVVLNEELTTPYKVCEILEKDNSGEWLYRISRGFHPVKQSEIFMGIVDREPQVARPTINKKAIPNKIEKDVQDSISYRAPAVRNFNIGGVGLIAISFFIWVILCAFTDYIGNRTIAIAIRIFLLIGTIKGVFSIARYFGIYKDD